jgi:hypothetical protein
VIDAVTAVLLLPLVEGAATAIGAGVVCGTFVGASFGALNGWSRKVVEGDALRMGFQGALWTLGIGLYDLCNVYASSL